VVEEQNNVKQITFILSVELIGETVEILKKKQKHSLPSPFVVLSNL
jgi:predicted nucleic acid-binding protein